MKSLRLAILFILVVTSVASVVAGSMLACHEAFNVADVNRDHKLDQSEYISFLNLLPTDNNNVVGHLRYNELPLALRENYQCYYIHHMQQYQQQKQQQQLERQTRPEGWQDVVKTFCSNTTAAITELVDGIAANEERWSRHLIENSNNPSISPRSVSSFTGSGHPSVSVTPSARPSSSRSFRPSTSSMPSSHPSRSLSPSQSSEVLSNSPSWWEQELPLPSYQPSQSPTDAPSAAPSVAPSVAPSRRGVPSHFPSSSPTISNSAPPSSSSTPRENPSASPSSKSSWLPSSPPTISIKSMMPSNNPSWWEQELPLPSYDPSQRPSGVFSVTTTTPATNAHSMKSSSSQRQLSPTPNAPSNIFSRPLVGPSQSLYPSGTLVASVLEPTESPAASSEVPSAGVSGSLSVLPSDAPTSVTVSSNSPTTSSSSQAPSAQPISSSSDSPSVPPITSPSDQSSISPTIGTPIIASSSEPSTNPSNTPSYAPSPEPSSASTDVSESPSASPSNVKSEIPTQRPPASPDSSTLGPNASSNIFQSHTTKTSGLSPTLTPEPTVGPAPTSKPSGGSSLSPSSSAPTGSSIPTFPPSSTFTPTKFDSSSPAQSSATVASSLSTTAIPSYFQTGAESNYNSDYINSTDSSTGPTSKLTVDTSPPVNFESQSASPSERPPPSPTNPTSSRASPPPSNVQKALFPSTSSADDKVLYDRCTEFLHKTYQLTPPPEVLSGSMDIDGGDDIESIKRYCSELFPSSFSDGPSAAPLSLEFKTQENATSAAPNSNSSTDVPLNDMTEPEDFVQPVQLSMNSSNETLQISMLSPTVSPDMGGNQIVRVYNTWEVSNTVGLTATAMKSSPHFAVLLKAYTSFIGQLISELPGQSGLPAPTNRRRLKVSFGRESADIYKLKDTTCPGSAQKETRCLTAFGQADLSITGESSKSIYTSYVKASQRAIFQGQLQKKLEEADPGSILTVSGAPTSSPEEQNASQPAVEAPTENQEANKSSSLTITVVSLLVFIAVLFLFFLLLAIYVKRRRQIREGKSAHYSGSDDESSTDTNDIQDANSTTSEVGVCGTQSLDCYSKSSESVCSVEEETVATDSGNDSFRGVQKAVLIDEGEDGFLVGTEILQQASYNAASYKPDTARTETATVPTPVNGGDVERGAMQLLMGELTRKLAARNAAKQAPCSTLLDDSDDQTVKRENTVKLPHWANDSSVFSESEDGDACPYEELDSAAVRMIQRKLQPHYKEENVKIESPLIAASTTAGDRPQGPVTPSQSLANEDMTVTSARLTWLQRGAEWIQALASMRSMDDDETEYDSDDSDDDQNVTWGLENGAWVRQVEDERSLATKK